MLVFAGCGISPSRHPSFAAVRESEYRSEATAADRIILPLTPEGRARLARFLRAGGVRAREGSEAVDPKAEHDYARLFALLANPSALTVSNLRSSPEFKEWFPAKPVEAVIDAREEDVVRPTPIAMLRGDYWWIFYPRKGELRALLVTRAERTKMER